MAVTLRYLGALKMQDQKMQDLKMQDLKMINLLGMRQAFVIRYSEHLWRAYTVIRFLYEFYYTKYTKQYILPYTPWSGAAPVLLNLHWLEHNNVSPEVLFQDLRRDEIRGWWWWWWWMSVLCNEYAGFKVIYVNGRFMGVPLQFVNKHVFTVILL